MGHIRTTKDEGAKQFTLAPAKEQKFPVWVVGERLGYEKGTPSEPVLSELVERLKDLCTLILRIDLAHHPSPFNGRAGRGQDHQLNLKIAPFARDMPP